ncbi:MAG: acetate kinase [Methylobacillus sp.]|nr:acetate kinase [Methylobacillus sp.]
MAVLKNILTINSGSSSLKASLFLADGARRDFRYSHIGHGFPHDHDEAFTALMKDLGDAQPHAIGHRFVHGGEIADAARMFDEAERDRLTGITHLAPLHMPGNLLGAELGARHFNVPQVVCFDTAFHATLPEIAWRLPIADECNMRRYGFHGINYAHVARQLPRLLGDSAQGRIAVAHLGNGASLCLLKNLQSVDTSMGYTPAGGIPMGTRSGDLDPGVVLELAKRMDSGALADTIYHRMGLWALSDGEDSEMSVLLQSTRPRARFAVEYFARQVCAQIGAYAAKAGGLDGIVFTGGIGEHAALVRALICAPLEFLGFTLDANANAKNQDRIATKNSRPILIVPADEEAEIARLTAELIPFREEK